MKYLSQDLAAALEKLDGVNRRGAATYGTSFLDAVDAVLAAYRLADVKEGPWTAEQKGWSGGWEMRRNASPYYNWSCNDEATARKYAAALNSVEGM